MAVPTQFAADLAYDQLGSTGPAVVFIHGLGSSRQAFESVRRLLPDARTYAVDLPGHGNSPAPLASVVTPAELADSVGGWLDGLGLTQVHMVGNSLGGWVALELAAAGRAASVVGLCPAGLWAGYTRRSPIMTANRTLARATRKQLPALLGNRLVRRISFATAVERFDLLTPEIAIAAGYAQADAEGFEACNDGMLHRRFEGAESINVPTTIVFGDRDRLLPKPHNQVRELAPVHARWEVIYRCGHAPMWDAPARTAQLIRETGGW